MEANEAKLNITIGGFNGDLADPISYDMPDDQVLGIATEAVRAGNVPGIPANPTADFTDFIVEHYLANTEVPFNRIFLRPKTFFGK